MTTTENLREPDQRSLQLEDARAGRFQGAQSCEFGGGVGKMVAVFAKVAGWYRDRVNRFAPSGNEVEQFQTHRHVPSPVAVMQRAVLFA